jgi:hypothetical protein
MAAVNWVALPKLVVRALPFQLMTEACVKLAPVTVRVSGLAPTTLLEGDIELMLGGGGTLAPPLSPPPQA